VDWIPKYYISGVLKKSKNRFLEIDLLRGIAVSGMIAYHFFFIGDFYNFFDINFKTLPWLVIARFIQFIFLGLVGVSLAVSKNIGMKFHLKQFKRFLVIVILAMSITFSTYILVPDRMIVWGVLHLIAFSILTLQFVAKKPLFTFSLGLFAMIFGFVIGRIGAEESLILNILGFNVTGFYALDYFPIFPWISVVAFGIVIGNLLYKNGRSVLGSVIKSSLGSDGENKLKKNHFVETMTLIGRHALFIYMTHFIFLIGFWEILKILRQQ